MQVVVAQAGINLMPDELQNAVWLQLLPHLGIHLDSGIVSATTIAATVSELLLLLILRLLYRRGGW